MNRFEPRLSCTVALIEIDVRSNHCTIRMNISSIIITGLQSQQTIGMLCDDWSHSFICLRNVPMYQFLLTKGHHKTWRFMYQNPLASVQASPKTEFSKSNLQKNEVNQCSVLFLLTKHFILWPLCYAPECLLQIQKKVRRGGCRREMFGQHGPSRQACLAKLAPGPAAVQCF